MIEIKKQGYTLIELSVVVVIIGLLIAAVAAGVNLVKQANLRSIISDMQGHVTSCNNFVLRFNKLPGDLDTAYTFWGSSCAANASFCNGNNDGIINKSFANISADETLKLWNHLYNAGMSTNVGSQPVTSTAAVPNQSVPASRISGLGYLIYGGTDALPFNPLSNAIFIGRYTFSTVNLLPSALYVPDVFSIDQKVDDGGFNGNGNPFGAVTGNWRAVDGSDVTAGNCVSNTTTGVYNLNNTTLSCRMGFLVTTS